MNDLHKLLAILHSYGWSEMTLLQQTELIYSARNELAALRAEVEAHRVALAAAEETIGNLRADVHRVLQNDLHAVDEFNAGYEACNADLDLDDAEQMYRHLNADRASYDQFSIGYAWAKFKAENAAALPSEPRTEAG